MTPTQAKKLGSALVSAGVLYAAHAEAHKCRGLAATHNTSGIAGFWAGKPGRPERACFITCDDVAQALLDAGRWTEDAIRACGHKAA